MSHLFIFKIRSINKASNLGRQFLEMSIVLELVGRPRIVGVNKKSDERTPGL